MDSKQYNVAVLGTESKPAVINFGTIGTHAMLGLIYATGEMVDVAKKAMFYGKEFDRFKFAEDAASLSDLAQTLRQQALDGDLNNPADIKAFADLPPHLAGLDLNNSLNKRLLHVVFGTSSESSEIANELRLAWEEKRPVDRVNMSEEIGDHFWYLAVGADELQVPLSVIFQQNITKLNDKKHGRYRGGMFDINEAVNRDLNTERATLEGSLVQPTKNDEQELIGTDTAHVFYDRKGHTFVWFDEAGLEGGRNPSYALSCNALNGYAEQLNGVHSTGHVDHSPESRNAGEMSVYEASRIANSIEGANLTHDRVPLERFGAAPATLGDKAKVYAGKTLDVFDAGIDKAKAYLGRK